MPARNGEGIALLADPTRRAIVAALALGPKRPSRLAAQLVLSRPTISNQLRLLSRAGLVWRHFVPGDGRAALYTISPLMHGQITAWLAGTEIARPLAGLEVEPRRQPGPVRASRASARRRRPGPPLRP